MKEPTGQGEVPRCKEVHDHCRCWRADRYGVRAWKYHLGVQAAETELEIAVCHCPPGASKWNKIEYRLFSFISINWRGKSLTNMRTIVELISATQPSPDLSFRHHTTRTGTRKVSRSPMLTLRQSESSNTTSGGNGTMPFCPRLRHNSVNLGPYLTVALRYLGPHPARVQGNP